MNSVSQNNFSQNLKKGFSLVEILIVTIIIMAVMSIINSSVFQKKVDLSVKLATLPELMRQIAKEDNRNSLELIIFGNECDKAVWTSENQILDKIENEVKINTKSLETYRFNSYGELEKVEYPKLRDGTGRAEEKCFEFKLFANQSTSSFIVSEEVGERKKKQFFVFRPYFQKVQIFDSLDDAKENYLNEELNPNVLE